LAYLGLFHDLASSLLVILVWEVYVIVPGFLSDAAPGQVQDEYRSRFQDSGNEAPVNFRICALADHLIQQELVQLTEDEESGREDIEPHRPDLSKYDQYDPGHHRKEQNRRGARPNAC